MKLHHTLNTSFTFLSLKAFSPKALRYMYYESDTPLQRSNKPNPTNYRPIFIISCFFKILKSLFTTFFSKHKVLYKAQYGFQKHTSTFYADLNTVSSPLRNINKNHFTKLTLIDFDKAFDTVPRSILLA